MHQEHHKWYTQRLGREMGVRVHGHYGLPILVFPTSNGDEWEYEGMHMITSNAHHIEAGRVKFFCVGSMNAESWNNDGAHPFHRSYVQARYDDYVASEVLPFIRHHCQNPDIAITTSGSSLGAFHAVNTLFKHPESVRRCLAMSGIYDMRGSMGGLSDDNFYFNNPMDYVANIHDEYTLGQLRRSDIHLITGTGPWEKPEHTYRFSDLLQRRGIAHSVDDWGPDGGHDWPYWKRQMDVYIDRLF
jgi:esterase/lipase superfamily enzyme